MKCNRHPRYRGAAPSTLKTLCHTCNFIRLIQRVRKAIGLSYALPKPRLVKALGAPWKPHVITPEAHAAVLAERKAYEIEFQKAMRDE